MKTIKFAGSLVELILNGSKTVTWRLFDDKDLQQVDELEFINRDTGEVFGYAKILWTKEKLIKDIRDEDYDAGHEKYKNTEELILNFGKYYEGREVDENTSIKIIKFKFKQL